jgi:hypothetical protein
MALAFPSSPTVGQTYTSGTRVWTWNGTVWKLPSTAISTITGTGSVVLNTSPTFSTSISVAGPVESTATGFKFPDATIQSTAAISVPKLNIVTATTQTAAASNHYVITNVAATTITMPATATAGDLIYITSGNGLATNVVAYSGAYKIMGLLENLTINTTAYTTMQLRYLNATIGWALI